MTPYDMTPYDIVGDIHGHADALEKLLKKLGYTHGRGGFTHRERKTVFLGDLIDRGRFRSICWKRY